MNLYSDSATGPNELAARIVSESAEVIAKPICSQRSFKIEPNSAATHVKAQCTNLRKEGVEIINKQFSRKENVNLAAKHQCCSKTTFPRFGSGAISVCKYIENLMTVPPPKLIQ